MKRMAEKFLGGVMYGPFCRTKAVDMSEWDADFETIARLGFNCAHGFAEWHDIEYEKGKFDFTQIDHMVACATKHGILPIINIATQNSVGFYSPRWLMEECRGGEFVDADGNKTSDAIYSVTCLDHPRYIEYAERFLHEVGKHFAGDSRVGGFVLWGEPMLFRAGGGPICYCEHTVARFRKWLEKKYGTIEALNVAWGTEGPSDFRDFASVYPPKGFIRQLGGYVSFRDFRRFMSDNFCTHIRRADEILKAAGATQPTIVEADVNGGGHSRCDTWDLSACPDIAGVSSFQNLSRDIYQVMWGVDSIGKMMDKSTFVVEILGGAVAFVNHVVPTRYEVASNLILRACMGASGAMYWTFRPRMSDLEGGEFGMTLRNGTPTYRAEVGGRTARLLAERSDALLSARRDAKVAVLKSDITIDFMEEEAHASRRGALALLHDLHVNADVIGEAYLNRLSDYRVLVMPFALTMTKGAAKKIAAFVKAGGVVIADYLVAMKTPDGICYRDLSETGLNEVFGLVDSDPYQIPPHEMADNAFGIRAGDRASMLYLDGAKTLASFAGRPVLTKNVCGRGEGYFIAHHFFRAYEERGGKAPRAVIAEILAKQGVLPYLSLAHSDACDVTPLYSTALTGESGAIYSVFNATEDTVTDTVFLPLGDYESLEGVPYEGKQTNEKTEIALSLYPKETAVFFKK